MPVLLVIDDEPLTRDCFRLLYPRGRVTVRTAATAAEGVAQFEAARPDAVVLDVRLPDASGLDTFARLKAIDPKVPVVLMTGYGTAETAIRAMGLGAFDYVLKPLDPDPLRRLLDRAFEVGRLMRVPARLPSDDDPGDDGDVLVGASPAMQDVYKAVGRVAPTDTAVLVTGETGTGKELVARAIYHHGRRADKPFLAINCAAIPEPLLESELFGHEKGAFTGADRRRAGKFEQADGGTVFLDEVGEMTALTQAKLLRVLQEKTFERVGGDATLRADVRVIAATNRDLEALVERGAFRRDLYYRLNVYAVRLPPLRDRGDDVALLARHFVRRFCRELGREPAGVPDETVAALQAYPWPGNVRELQSVLKRALLGAPGPVLGPDALPPEVRGATPAAEPGGGLADFIRARLAAGTTDLHAEVLARTERELFAAVLAHTGYNLTQAARALGISRTTLRARLAALGIAIDRSPTLAADDDG
jgi:two-component system nitrogen regulation response regulator GlnG